jgi:hypothetical protein
VRDALALLTSLFVRGPEVNARQDPDIDGHRDLVSALAFTRDGRLLASSGGLITRLWRAGQADGLAR